MHYACRMLSDEHALCMQYVGATYMQYASCKLSKGARESIRFCTVHHELPKISSCLLRMFFV